MSQERGIPDAAYQLQVRKNKGLNLLAMCQANLLTEHRQKERKTLDAVFLLHHNQISIGEG